MEPEVCPLCGCNKKAVWEEAQRRVFDGSLFMGRPIAYWVQIHRVMVSHGINGPEELDHRLLARTSLR